MLFCLLSLCLSQATLANETRQYYLNSQDSSTFCSLLVLPEGSTIKGLIVRDYSRLPKPEDLGNSPYQWSNLALENQLAILYTVSSKVFPELYADPRGPMYIDQLIQAVLHDYPIPRNNIFIGGISASGFRALRYTQYCNAGKSEFDIQIKGCFAVDPPLDIVRFYQSVHWNGDRLKAGMKEEAELMKAYFKNNYALPLEEFAEPYHENSVYSYSSGNCDRPALLLGTAILLIHEPDIEWWLKERNASYFDINSFDITGLVTCLQYLEHQDLELIETSGKGFDRAGNRNCHSWTIVDEEYLINWILARCEE